MHDQPPEDDGSDAPIALFLTYRLSRVQARLSAQASRILRDHAGITITQWRIIAVLAEGARCTSAQLSRMTAMDKGLISRNVKSLAAAGLVSVTRDSHDNRALYLGLTDKGQQVYDHTMPRMRARQEALRAYLSHGEEEALIRTLEKLERAAGDPDI